MVQKQFDFSGKLGVNLDGMFCSPTSRYFDGKICRGYFIEDDFSTAADLGFDFVRLPLSYRLLVKDNSYKLDDSLLKLLDQAIEWSAAYRLHVNVNFHRAPGYCINDDEPGDNMSWMALNSCETERRAFCEMWQEITRRYMDVPAERLSFDLLNEPSHAKDVFPRESYCRLMRETVEAIHALDAKRLCVIDGWACGEMELDELSDIPNTMQSCRGYFPKEVTHYKCMEWSQNPPQWPMTVPGYMPGNDAGVVWNPDSLDAYFRNWKEFSEKYSIPVMCGEFGCISTTPAPVFYAWLNDFIGIMAKYEIGCALWTLEGVFGLFESGRSGVTQWKTYHAENSAYDGKKYDAEMLRILQKIRL